MENLNKKIKSIEPSKNARKSLWREKKGDKCISRRGGPKYYLYIQERYNDIYCFIVKSKLFPELKDNFIQENLVKRDKKLIELKRYLTFLELKKNKKITFSLNSIKL